MFPITLLSADARHSARGRIPFVPVAGMFLMAPWAKNDYHRVDQVFYNHLAESFEVYLADNDAPAKPLQTLPNPAQKGANA